MEITVLGGVDGATCEVGGQSFTAAKAFVEISAGTVPTVTVVSPTTAISVEGVLQVVNEPDEHLIRDTAKQLLLSVDPVLLETECQARVRAGRNDPWRVFLEVLEEQLDG